MPPPKPTIQPRRPILRFGLQNMRINGRNSLYRDPQLVIKPQLEIPPRIPYTGAQPQMPRWRTLLMVHVKDKADELVKLDLADFRFSPGPTTENRGPQRFIRCLYSQASITIQFPSSNGYCTLSFALKISELDSFLAEMRALNIIVDLGHTRNDNPREITPRGYFDTSEGNSPATPRPHASEQQRYHMSPPLSVTSAPRSQYTSYSTVPQGSITSSRSDSQNGWHPAIKLPRPTPSPGILSPGLYKVSKVTSSLASSRQRAKKPVALLNYDGSRLHADPSVRGQLFGTQTARSSPVQAAPRKEHTLNWILSQDPPELARTPSAEFKTTDRYHPPEQEYQQQSPALTQLYTTPGGPNTSHTQSTAPTPINPAPKFVRATVTDVPFQPTPTPAPIRETRPDPPIKRKVDSLGLWRISEVSHEGLSEATRLWDEFMEKGRQAMKSSEDPKKALDSLAKYEKEFTHRWNRIVAAHDRELREVLSKTFS
ncbi:hypothetical protein QBC35DRAFT_488619 [Podospora australis]|uniref:Uncharacterized protein n=1 Tax=Podospora australis TaxID=1536484 RepID=A0AAN6WZ99_9PEZI|nr:hypothetical protein QBC35DRAFT_488619 [Podospora australis]